MGLKHRIREALTPYPRLFLPLYRLLAPASHARLAIAHDTEIVIEGFPRSANTFAVVAFEQAQGDREVRIAHHLHAEAQVLEGVARGLPVIVLIRRPEDAIRSLKVALPGPSANRLLDLYLRFYRMVETVRDHVVIAEFACTTSRFGTVVAEVNERFGTDYALPDDSEAGVEAVFERISQINAEGHGQRDLIARPAAHKEEAKRTVELEFDAGKLAEARALFARLTRYAGDDAAAA